MIADEFVLNPTLEVSLGLRFADCARGYQVVSRKVGPEISPQAAALIVRLLCVGVHALSESERAGLVAIGLLVPAASPPRPPTYLMSLDEFFVIEGDNLELSWPLNAEASAVQVASGPQAPSASATSIPPEAVRLLRMIPSASRYLMTRHATHATWSIWYGSEAALATFRERRGAPCSPARGTERWDATETLAQGVCFQRAFLDPVFSRLLFRYYDALRMNGGLIAGDTFVHRRLFARDDRMGKSVLESSTDAIARIIGVRLRPEFSYISWYLEGAVLAPHRDRRESEVNVSVLLARSRADHNGDDVWPLTLELCGDEVRFPMKVGDALIYGGHETLHWRPGPNPYDCVLALSLHYSKINP